MREPLPQSPQIRVSVAPTVQHVGPGEQAVYLVTIENRGSEAQAQTLDVSGLAAGWYRVDFDARRRVFPGEERTATLVVSPPRDAGGGQHPFEVGVKAGAAETRVACSLEITAPAATVAPAAAAPVLAPEISLTPAVVVWRGEAQGEERLTLRVRNAGDQEAQYNVRLDGLERAWYALTSRLRVPGGQALETEIRLHPPARARQGEHSFTVSVSLEGNADLKSETAGRISIPLQERAARAPRAVAPVSAEPTPAPAEPRAPSAPVLPPDVSLGPRTTFRFGAGEVTSQATITVLNRSRLIERYQVTLTGIPQDWFVLPLTDLRLEPGTSGQVPLQLTPRPGPAHPAGDYEFRVRVAPLSFPASFAEIRGHISIAGTTAFDARLVPAQTNGRKEKFKLTLLNTGSLPLSLWLEGADPEGMCKFNFSPPPNLDPGQEAVVPITVGARRNGFVGDPRRLDFRFRVSPAGGTSTAVRAFDGRFVHQPFLTSRMLSFSALMSVVATIIGLLLVIGFSHVGQAATWVSCGFNDEFHEFKNGPTLIKEKCGGAPIPCQKGFCVGGEVRPTPAATSAATAAATASTATAGGTPTPDGATSTPPPAACASDQRLAIAVGKAVTLQAIARIRSNPGVQQPAVTPVPPIARGPTSPGGMVIAGPQCVDNLVWWQVDWGTLKGWTAEEDENGEQLLFPR